MVAAQAAAPGLPVVAADRSEQAAQVAASVRSDRRLLLLQVDTGQLPPFGGIAAPGPGASLSPGDILMAMPVPAPPPAETRRAPKKLTEQGR